VSGRAGTCAGRLIRAVAREGPEPPAVTADLSADVPQRLAVTVDEGAVVQRLHHDPTRFQPVQAVAHRRTGVVAVRLPEPAPCLDESCWVRLHADTKRKLALLESRSLLHPAVRAAEVGRRWLGSSTPRPS